MILKPNLFFVRRSDHFFCLLGWSSWFTPVTKQRLSHWWLRPLAYTSQGLYPPEGLRAHSTQDLTASWALFKGVCLQNIWATGDGCLLYLSPDVDGCIHQPFRVGIMRLMLLRAAERGASHSQISLILLREQGYVNNLKSLIGINVKVSVCVAVWMCAEYSWSTQRWE